LQGEATRLGLVQAAVQALESGGEQAVRVREVAAVLGVSVGAVYHHFESREELIVAARIHQFIALASGDVEAVRELVERSATVAELRRGMHFLTRAAHSGARARYRRLRAEVAGVAGHNPHLTEALAAAQEQCTSELAAVVDDAKAKGLVRAEFDSRAVATLLQGVTLGLVLDDINLAHPAEPDAWFALVDHLYEQLLAAD